MYPVELKRGRVWALCPLNGSLKKRAVRVSDPRRIAWQKRAEDWVSFEEATEKLEELNEHGIRYLLVRLSDGLLAYYDWDLHGDATEFSHHTGELLALAEKTTWTEKSLSGKGRHSFGLADSTLLKRSEECQCDLRAGSRYFVMTGDRTSSVECVSTLTLPPSSLMSSIELESVESTENVRTLPPSPLMSSIELESVESTENEASDSAVIFRLKQLGKAYRGEYWDSLTTGECKRLGNPSRTVGSVLKMLFVCSDFNTSQTLRIFFNHQIGQMTLKKHSEKWVIDYLQVIEKNTSRRGRRLNLVRDTKKRETVRSREEVSELRERARELSNGGMSQRAIARELGVSQKAVFNYLHSENNKPKSIDGMKKLIALAREKTSPSPLMSSIELESVESTEKTEDVQEVKKTVQKRSRSFTERAARAILEIKRTEEREHRWRIEHLSDVRMTA